MLYLDNAASTPLDPAVVTVMHDVLTHQAANPASTHGPGRQAAAIIEQARGQVALAIGAQADEILWTSGATEANNLALKGLALAWQQSQGKPGHLVSLCTEHRSVLDPLRELEARGWRISRLPVAANGRLGLARLEQALAPDTAAVSVMHVNNETGVIQDISAIGALLRDHPALLHVDAAQSAGKMGIDVNAWGVDLLSLSAHKLHGPQGVGALYRRRRPLAPLQPLLHGGGQESGMRAGTLAVHQIAGMGEAYRLAGQQRDSEQPRLAALRERLWAALAQDGILRNGDARFSAAWILNISVEGVHPEALLSAVTGGEQALAVSAGSACASSQWGSSYVLRTMGREPVLAAAALRLSLGRFSTTAQVDLAAQKITREICRLRMLAPAVTRKYGCRKAS